MPRTELIKHLADTNNSRPIQVTAICQRDGTVALTRSQIFDPKTERYDLLSWAKDLKSLASSPLDWKWTQPREATEFQ